MNNFYFRCKACNNPLRHPSRVGESANHITEESLCSYCKRVAMQSFHSEDISITDEEDYLDLEQI